jgi:ABC-type Mn2+/Zn2+ transport system permease subunit
VGNTAIQVRAALLGMLLSVVLENAIPLIAGALLVAVFAAYTNGYTEETEASGGAA